MQKFFPWGGIIYEDDWVTIHIAHVIQLWLDENADEIPLLPYHPQSPNLSINELCGQYTGTEFGIGIYHNRISTGTCSSFCMRNDITYHYAPSRTSICPPPEEFKWL